MKRETKVRFLIRKMVREIMNESATSQTASAHSPFDIGGEVDDGPGFLFGDMKSVLKRGNYNAEQVGYEVLNRLMKTQNIKLEPKAGIPDGYPVSFAPSGIGTGDENNIDVKNTASWGMYNKHISKVATSVGMRLMEVYNFNKKDGESK